MKLADKDIKASIRNIFHTLKKVDDNMSMGRRERYITYVYIICISQKEL